MINPQSAHGLSPVPPAPAPPAPGSGAPAAAPPAMAAAMGGWRGCPVGAPWVPRGTEKPGWDGWIRLEIG